MLVQLTSRAAKNGATINAQLAVRFAVVISVSTETESLTLVFFQMLQK